MRNVRVMRNRNRNQKDWCKAPHTPHPLPFFIYLKAPELTDILITYHGNGKR